MKNQPTNPVEKPALLTRIRQSIQRDPILPGDDRGRMKMVMNSLVLHIHPSKVSKPALKFTYTFGLGGLLILLGTILAVTGVLLIFVYTPSPEAAYESMIALRTEIPFGNLMQPAPLVRQSDGRGRGVASAASVLYCRIFLPARIQLGYGDFSTAADRSC